MDGIIRLPIPYRRNERTPGIALVYITESDPSHVAVLIETPAENHEDWNASSYSPLDIAQEVGMFLENDIFRLRTQYWVPEYITAQSFVRRQRAVLFRVPCPRATSFRAFAHAVVISVRSTAERFRIPALAVYQQG